MITLLILFSCILAGFLLRNAGIPRIPSSAASVIVWILLFLFGISIGANSDIISNLDKYGSIALAIALAGILGSIIGAAILWRISDKNHRK